MPLIQPGGIVIYTSSQLQFHHSFLLTAWGISSFFGSPKHCFPPFVLYLFFLFLLLVQSFSLYFLSPQKVPKKTFGAKAHPANGGTAGPLRCRPCFQNAALLKTPFRLWPACAGCAEKFLISPWLTSNLTGGVLLGRAALGKLQRANKRKRDKTHQGKRK